MKKNKEETEFNKFLKIIKPEDPVTAELKYNGKTFKWCGIDTGGKCVQYVLHKPSQCKGKLAKKSSPMKKKKSSKSATIIVSAAAAYKGDNNKYMESVSISMAGTTLSMIYNIFNYLILLINYFQFCINFSFEFDNLFYYFITEELLYSVTCPKGTIDSKLIW